MLPVPAAILLLAPAAGRLPVLQETSAPGEPLPPGVVAAWDGGTISEEEFAAFLGATFKDQNLGREGLEHILQIRLVELEAGSRGLEVPAGALEDRLARARKEVEAAGEDLDHLLASRGLDRAEFRKLLRDSILHEMLVRQDLGRDAGAPVSPDELRAWTRRRIGELLEKVQEAPPGFALREPPYVVTEPELGRALLGALGPARLRDYVADLVLYRHLQAWARERGRALTDDLLQEELDWQAQRAADSGADLGLLLQAAGTTLDEVKRRIPLRTTSLLRLVARERYDDAWFDALPAERRRELEARFGEARLVLWAFLHAVPPEEKQGPLQLTFAEAEEELRRRAADMGTDEAFRKAAAAWSEDEASRMRRGLLGWIHRRQPGTDPALCAAAFAAAPGETAGPVRLARGVALLRVLDVRRPASEAAFREEVRRGLHPELRRTILREIHFRTLWDPRPDPAAAGG